MRFLILIIFIVFAYSKELNIDDKIEAILNAPKEKRVELMNNLKKEIAKMNKDNQLKIIEQLKTKINFRHNNQIVQQHLNEHFKLQEKQQHNFKLKKEKR